MRLPRYFFTGYAVLASLLWIVVMFAGTTLERTAAGQAFIFLVVRILIIPLYLIQTLLVILIVAIRGGPPTSPGTLGTLSGIAQWILSLLPFVLIDRWRARRSGPGTRFNTIEQ